MRLGEVVDLLKRYTAGGCTPGYDGYADITDVLEELNEPDDRSGHARERRPRAGGVDLRGVDIGHIVRLGLQATIEAHRHVEAARAPMIAAAKRQDAEAAAAKRQAELAKHVDDYLASG